MIAALSPSPLLFLVSCCEIGLEKTILAVSFQSHHHKLKWTLIVGVIVRYFLFPLPQSVSVCFIPSLICNTSSPCTFLAVAQLPVLWREQTLPGRREPTSLALILPPLPTSMCGQFLPVELSLPLLPSVPWIPSPLTAQSHCYSSSCRLFCFIWFSISSGSLLFLFKQPLYMLFLLASWE